MEPEDLAAHAALVLREARALREEQAVAVARRRRAGRHLEGRLMGTNIQAQNLIGVITIAAARELAKPRAAECSRA